MASGGGGSGGNHPSGGSQDLSNVHGKHDDMYLLRLPPDVASRLRSVLRSSPDARPEDFLMTLDPIRGHTSAGTFTIGADEFDAHLVDLPCVSEVYKTYDGTSLVKSGDVGQAVVVTPQGIKPNQQKVYAAHGPSMELVDGITPPAADARKRHFGEPIDEDIGVDTKLVPRLMHAVEHDLLKAMKRETANVDNYACVVDSVIETKDEDGVLRVES